MSQQDEQLAEQDDRKAWWPFYFWKFVHNAIVHPAMSLPIDEPAWLNRLHDWTGERCKGAG